MTSMTSDVNELRNKRSFTRYVTTTSANAGKHTQEIDCCPHNYEPKWTIDKKENYGPEPAVGHHDNYTNCALLDSSLFVQFIKNFDTLRAALCAAVFDALFLVSKQAFGLVILAELHATASEAFSRHRQSAFRMIDVATAFKLAEGAVIEPRDGAGMQILIFNVRFFKQSFIFVSGRLLFPTSWASHRADQKELFATDT